MHEACSQFFYTVDIIAKGVSLIWTITISKVGFTSFQNTVK